MATGTFGQPDYTSDDATTYKTKLDVAVAIVARMAAKFAVHENGTPDMHVVVDPGPVFDGSTLTEKAAQTLGPVTAPTTNPRIDRVVIDQVDGTASIVTGSEAASPSPPAIPAGKFPLAQISLVVSQSSILNLDISDERAFGDVGGATGTYTGLTDTPPNFTADGLKLVRVNTGETALEHVALADIETDPTLTASNSITIGDGSSGGNLDLNFDGDAGTDGVLRYDTSTDSFKPQNEVEFGAGIGLKVDFSKPPDNGNGDFEDFADGDASYPSGWTEDDAAATARTDKPVGLWRLVATTGDATYQYSQQRSKNVESLSANEWASYIIGPVWWNDNQWPTDDVDYYFGQHANNAGSPSTTVYARVRLQRNATSGTWRVRGEIKDGTTETQGSWHTFTFPTEQPVYFRITTQNQANKTCRVYMSTAPPALGFGWFKLHEDTPGQTWGQIWSVFAGSRGTSDSDFAMVWIGQLQDAGNAA